MNKEYPLGLPKGSVRAIIALIMWLGIFIMMMLGKEIPGEIWTAGGMIAAFYFGLRTDNTGGKA